MLRPELAQTPLRSSMLGFFERSRGGTDESQGAGVWHVLAARAARALGREGKDYGRAITMGRGQAFLGEPREGVR